MRAVVQRRSRIKIRIKIKIKIKIEKSSQKHKDSQDSSTKWGFLGQLLDFVSTAMKSSFSSAAMFRSTGSTLPTPNAQ